MVRIARLVEIRAQTVREVAEQTSANAAAVYGIALVGTSEPAEERETL